MAFIEVRNLSKIYKMGDLSIKANDDISFEINEGEFTLIIGPSGAGKSTLLNIMGGMDRASSGEIIIDGKDITKLSDKGLTSYRRSDMGFVFQFYNLIPNLTTIENVELATQIVKDSKDPMEVLKAVGLEDRVNNFPSQLSGGEQQRASIARALSKNPKLLLCDEPTGALDYKTGRQVLKLLQDLSREKKVTVIVITHNKEIAKSADRVIEIVDAKVRNITTNDNPEDILKLHW